MLGMRERERERERERVRESERERERERERDRGEKIRCGEISFCHFETASLEVFNSSSRRPLLFPPPLPSLSLKFVKDLAEW